MNKFKHIPTSFKIASQEIKVLKKEYIEDGTYMGLADLVEGVITLADKCTIRTISLDTKLNTFYHELTHIILDQYGYNELSSNEIFINQFAALLTSWYTSDKYEIAYVKLDKPLNDIEKHLKNSVSTILDMMLYKEDDKDKISNMLSIGLLEFEKTVKY